MNSTLLHERTKSQPILLTLFFIIVLISEPYSIAATQHYPGKIWNRVKTPEELGWSSEALKLARQYSESIGSAAVMIIVNGEILDEWGETTKKFNVHSIIPTVCLDVISLVASSCGYKSGQIEQLVVH